MRDTTAPLPAPKMNATKLKSNTPTKSQTSAPIITNAKAIIVVIFILFPRTKSMGSKFYFIHNYSKIFISFPKALSIME